MLRATNRLLLPAAAVIIAASATWVFSGGSQESIPLRDHSDDFGVRAGPPETIDSIANNMTAVVRGVYVDVERMGTTAPPRSAAEQGVTDGRPITYMRFAASEYIVGDGSAEFTIVQYGDFSKDLRASATPPRFGEEVTVVIAPWTLDPSVVVAVNGDYGRFTARDGRLAYAFISDEDAEHEYFGAMPFAEGMTLDQFHEALRDAARQRGLVVPER